MVFFNEKYIRDYSSVPGFCLNIFFCPCNFLSERRISRSCGGTLVAILGISSCNAWSSNARKLVINFFLLAHCKRSSWHVMINTPSWRWTIWAPTFTNFIFCGDDKYTEWAILKYNSALVFLLLMFCPPLPLLLENLYCTS